MNFYNTCNNLFVLILYRTNKKLLALLYRSFVHVGIVHLVSQLPRQSSTNTTTMVEPVAGLCGMAYGFYSRPTPAASKEGVDRGWCGGV